MPTVTMNTKPSGRRSASSLLAAAAIASLIPLTFAVMADRSGLSLFAEGPLSSGRSRILFAAASEKGDGAGAVTSASQLVRWAPLSRGSVSALGVAYELNGELQLAQNAFRVASSFGWRDEVAQTFAVRQALSNEEYELAAFRMEALLRAEPEGALTTAMLADVAATPLARQALAVRMGEDLEWTDNVLLGLDETPKEEIVARISLLDEARQQGYRPADRQARWETFALYEKDPSASWLLWQALFGPGELETAGMWDANFGVASSTGSGSSAPFEWHRLKASTAQVRQVEGGGGKRLEVVGVSYTPQDVAQQSVGVIPGRYVLAWQSSKEEEGRPDLHLSATCKSVGGTVTLGPIVPADGGFGRLLNVDRDCQMVTLRIFAPSGRPAPRWLEAPQMARID